MSFAGSVGDKFPETLIATSVQAAGASVRNLNSLFTNSKRVENWQKTLRLDPCSYCGEPGGTVDHIWPLYHREEFLLLKLPFGMGGWPNLTGACETCNSAKAAKQLLEFLIERNHEICSATQE